MRTLWTAVSIVAVANLLSLAGFAGWLVHSDRLNLERLRQVRLMLSETAAAERLRLESEERARAAAAAEEAARVKADRPPLTASELLAARVELTNLDRERGERLKREVADLQASLETERERLRLARAQLDADRRAFEAMVAANASQLEEQQFQRSLSTLTSLRPRDAVLALREVLAGALAVEPGATPAAPPAERIPGTPLPRTPHGMAQVVAYLDAMEDRARSRIMTELVKDDPQLAAELLERIRTRGQMPPGSANP